MSGHERRSTVAQINNRELRRFDCEEMEFLERKGRETRERMFSNVTVRNGHGLLLVATGADEWLDGPRAQLVDDSNHRRVC